MSARLEVVDDPARVCGALLHAVAGAGRAAEVVLTGGTTPAGAYRQAAALGGDWSQTRLWFSDERCVDPGDARSNAGLVRESLLAGLAVGDGRAAVGAVERMTGELGPEAGAAHAAEAFVAAGSPRFDLVLLGLGPDGHIASLFPGRPEVAVRDRPVVGVPEAGHEPYVPRISLTFAALLPARRIVVLVTGEAKAAALARAFGPAAAPSVDAPAALLAAEHPELTVLCDRAAAATLRA